VSRIRMSMVLSSLTRAPLGYLSSDIEAVQYSSFHLKPSKCAEPVNTSIGKYGYTEYQLQSDSAYSSYEIMSNRSGEPSSSHESICISDKASHRFIHSVKSETLLRVLIGEPALASSLALDCDSAGPVEPQMPSKAVYFVQIDSSMLREVRNRHFGTTPDLYGRFRAPDLLNMAMAHWFMSTRCCVVEPRLPADRHAQWKKRRKKSAGIC